MMTNNPHVEQLENRRLMSVSLSNGILKVVGTSHDDDIFLGVAAYDSTKIEVRINGKLSTFELSAVHHVNIYGLAGNDKLWAAPDEVDFPTLSVGLYLVGGDGNDMLIGGNGNDTLIGGRGADDLRAEAGDDLLIGGGGNDRMLAGTGNDFLNGGVGNDDLIGQEGNDTLLGGVGRDVLIGNENADCLYGGQGDDILFGGDGGDYLFGGVGQDTLQGDQRHDRLAGGDGQDQFDFVTKVDEVLDFSPGDTKAG